jgi:uncharacterized protein
MKLLLGSDYHDSPLLQEEALLRLAQADVAGYINCGDFCTYAGSKHHSEILGYDLRGETEVQHLITFLQRLEAVGKPWLFIPGNHDPSAPFYATLNPTFRWGQVITASTLVWFGGLRLLVVPWTPPCGWSWTLTHQHVQELLTTYRTTTIDVLVTHGPPKGALDEESKWYHRKTPTLRPLVDLLAPPYVFCGHMHHDGGKTLIQGPTTFVNAALCNMEVTID